MKRLLVNVRDADEVRVAVLENDRLLEYHVEPTHERQLRGNIYVGRVLNIEPAIQAAFIDIGESKTAFMHVSDLHPAYAGAHGIPFEELGDPGPADERPLIQSILRRNQLILVQVTKEAIGHKGPSVTSFVSLPGRSVVLLAGMARYGVSKKIVDPEKRERLRQLAEELRGDDPMGVIVRTAAADQPREDLENDLQYLRQLWAGVVRKAKIEAPPVLLYQESDLVIRTIRDLFEDDIQELILDSHAVTQRAREFLESVMPRYAKRVRLYEGEVPLFDRYRVEPEIESIYDRRVSLPSGGSLVIDETEALVAVDVNSGRSRDQEDLEETALLTNLEAAVEIARQLRLRDIGGVVVCDFIDMLEGDHRRRVESTLRTELRKDRSKTWIARMSRFGLIEMTRQRLRPSKDRVSRRTCPVCHGRGTVRSHSSATAALLRQLQRGLTDRPGQAATVEVSADLLSYLMNHARDGISRVERDTGRRVWIELDPGRVADDYGVRYHAGI